MPFRIDLQGLSKEAILKFEGLPDNLSPKINKVMKGSYKKKSKRRIQGSGYVVESLEAALWSFYHGNDFRHAILEAVNLGRDADTTGAVCGQLAGAYWGKSGIPDTWLQKLTRSEEISSTAEKLISINSIPDET